MHDKWLAGTVIQRAQLHFIHPAIPTRAVPEEVGEPFAQEYREAAATLAISPKASAALSRRLLQHLLREKGEVKPGNLVAEIEEMQEKNVLPAILSEDLDSVRHVGNFAAHPIKDKETEAVADVEVGEASWMLDLLDDLLAAFFVAPAKRKIRRHLLNEKLKAAGKPLLDGEDDKPAQEGQN